MKDLYIIENTNKNQIIYKILTDPFVIEQTAFVMVVQTGTGKVNRFDIDYILRVYNSLKQAQQQILQEKKDV